LCSERLPSPKRSDSGAVTPPERRTRDPVEDEGFRRDVQTPARRSANDKQIMGRWVNRRAINVRGWLTTGAMFAATIGLVLTWIA
jgi:hypothetical protein